MADTWPHTLETSLLPSSGCSPRNRNPLDQRNMPNQSPCPSLLVHTVDTQAPGISCLNGLVPAPRACAGHCSQSILLGVEHPTSVQHPWTGGPGHPPACVRPSWYRTEMQWGEGDQEARLGTGDLQLTFLGHHVWHETLKHPRILNLTLSFQIVMKICFICQGRRTQHIL